MRDRLRLDTASALIARSAAIDLRVEPVVAPPAARTPVRQKIWELQGGLQCSIVGTCLSDEDLLAVSRKSGIRPREGARAYEVHSYFVQQAGKDCKVARVVQKLLDQRHAGILRRVAAARSEAELTTLWEAEYNGGRVPGAYWAFLTTTHVPGGLATRIFGDVHMLSHVLGRVTHENASRASDLQSRLDDLDAKLLRQAERHRQIVIERDTALMRLVEASRAAMAPTPLASRVGAGTSHEDDSAPRIRRGTRPDRRERALAATRERARAAERTVADLTRQLALLRWQQRMRPANVPVCPGAEVCDETVQTSIARRILYVGGRSGAVDNLRRVAARMGAELVHHDGGEEHALVRIDGMVEGCDAVFCPIDCVSHSACLRAKALCRKFAKPFLPLRSAGASSFERAVQSLTSRAG
jgi:Uncharacterized protein conserved in bacteria (DUF2325)